MSIGLAKLPTECWLIDGTLSNGSPFFSRVTVEEIARSRAKQMNAMGASVNVKRQVREPEDWTWTDAGGAK
jgi:hypothetical protein